MPPQDANPTPSFGGFGLKTRLSPRGIGVATIQYLEADLRSRNALHSLVGEIADGLVQEIKNRSLEDVPGEANPADDFASIVAKEVAMEVTQRLPMPTSDSATPDHGVQDRLAALESRLEKFTAGSGGSSKGEPETSLPNLKYAKSKPESTEGHRWTA